MTIASNVRKLVTHNGLAIGLGRARRASSNSHKTPDRTFGLEQLEPRRLLAMANWDGDAGDNAWSTAENWEGDVLPTAQDIVIINGNSEPIVVGDAAAASLMTAADLSIFGTLTVAGMITFSGANVHFSGGAIAEAYLNFSEGSNIVSGSGNLINASTNKPIILESGQSLGVFGEFDAPSIRLRGSASVGFSNMTGFNGPIIAEGSASGLRQVVFGGSANPALATLWGGMIEVAADCGGGLQINISGGHRVINSGTIISHAIGKPLSILAPGKLTNGGTISNPSGSLTIGIGEFINEGTLICATGPLVLQSTQFVNSGVINTTNAAITLLGTYDIATGMGTWNRSGGSVSIQGTIDGPGTLLLDSSTGSWDLSGGTIDGCTVEYADGQSLNFASGGGTLNSVALPLGISYSNTGQLTLNNTTVPGEVILGFGGNVLIRGSTAPTAIRMTAQSTLSFYPGYVLTAPVIAEGAAGGTRRINFALGPSGTNTIGLTGSIRLASGCGGGVLISQGLSASLINNGTISAEASGRTLQIQTQSFSNRGIVRLTTGTLQLATIGSYTNTGSIIQTGGTLELAGTFNATAGIGGWSRTGGTVNLTGTLNNASNTLTMNSTTGSWNLSGGTVSGGTVLYTGAFGLNITSTGGTLANVAIQGDLVLGLSDNLTVSGSTSFTAARLTDASSLSLATGYTLNSPIVAEGSAAGARAVRFALGSNGTNTIGPTGSIRLLPGCGGPLTLSNNSQATIVNNGLISNEAPGRTLTINTTGFTNNATAQATAGTLSITSTNASSTGSLRASGAGRLDFSGGGTFSGTGVLSVAAQSQIELRGDLYGSTTNRDAVPGPGKVVFDGTGTAANPQDLEAMSANMGAVAAGFTRNFAFGTIQLATGTYVRLIDASDNSTGAAPEAVYVSTLIVPAGSTLDLNGRTLYARAYQILGTLIGGTITPVPDSGPISTAAPVPGAISAAGEMDEWSFFAYQGREVTVVVNPSTSGNDPALPPPILRVQVSVLDEHGNTLASGSSTTDNQLVTLGSLQIPATGTYRVRVQSIAAQPMSTGSYTVALWDSSADVSGIALNQLVNGGVQSPYSVDRWTFAAEAGLQVRFDLTALNSGGLRFALTGPSGYVGFANATGDSALLTLPSTGTYTLTATGPGGATGQYSFKLVQTQVTDLEIDVPQTLVLAGTDSARLFRVVLTEETPLLVRMDDANNADRNEMYIRFGQAPTRTEYDLRYTLASSADQSLVISNAQAGEWFVLVYGRSVAAASTFMIEAVAAPVVIRDSAPNRHRASGTVVLNITGAGFRPGVEVDLLTAGGAVVSTSTDVEINGFSSASVTMPLAGVPIGQYGLRVRMPGGGSDTLLNAFRVTAAGTPRFEARLILPDELGRQTTTTIYVEYANTGTDEMPAPLIQVRSGDANNSDKPLLTLDQSRLVPGFWTSTLADGFGHTVEFLASGATPGILLPGERVTVPVYYAGLLGPWDVTDGTVEIEIASMEVTNTELIPWNDLREVSRPPSVNAEGWDAVFANLMANVGTTWGQYVQTMSDNARYLGKLGQRVIDGDSLWAFERYQAAGINVVGDLSQVSDASFDTPGGGFWFGRTYSGEMVQRFQKSIFGRGWAAPWLTRLTFDSNGTIGVESSTGTVRRFEPDFRFLNKFNGVGGDPAKIVRTKGQYLLTDPSGTKTRFDSDGRLLWAEDANANRFTMQYSGSRLVGIASATNGTIALAYNAAGLVSSVTDPAGRTTTYGYDATNQYLTSVTAWNGRVTTYAYETSAGSQARHALTQISALGTTRHFEYDTRGRMAATYRDAGLERTDFSYNTTGRVSLSNSVGATNTYFYDHLARPSRQVDAFGQVSSAEFGADGRVSRVIDPLGQAEVFTWCSCGALVSSTDAAGNTARFTYANVGPNGTIKRMVSSTDQNGNVTRYTYDSRGNLLATISPDGPQETFTSYNAVGNANAFVNRRGQAVTFLYDTAGRVTRQTYADTTFDSWTYDAFGRLASSTDRSSQTTTYTYNPLGELSRIDYPAGRFLTYTYDTQGRRSTMTDQSGFVVNYAYNAAGRLQQISDGSNTVITSYLYDALGRITRETNANGTYTEFGYDAVGRTTSIVNRAPGGAVNSQLTYAYDVLGRLVETISLDGTWAYEYDAIGQLIDAQFTPAPGSTIPAQSLEYVYDAAGNRVRTIENGVVTDYTTNVLNQYIQIGADVLTYDADGNLVSRSGPSGTATYAYDQLSRLTNATNADGAWDYTYDGLGNRISAAFNGQRTDYIIDPAGLGNLVGEYTAAGALSARNFYAAGLVARQDGLSGQRAFYDADIIGSVVGVTGLAGSNANTYAYTPFGQKLSSVETISNAFEYVGIAGVETLDNGLMYMRARHYTAASGRFMTLDPIGLSGGDMNMYRYVGNAPTDHLDPLGLAGFAIGGSGYLGLGGGVKVTFNLDGTICFTVEGGAGVGAGVDLGIVPTETPGDSWGQSASASFLFVSAGAGWEQSLDGDEKVEFDGGIGVGGKPIELVVKVWTRSRTWCRKNPVVTDTANWFQQIENGWNYLFGGKAPVQSSIDPNALYGPDGFGPLNFVAPNLALPYLIEFENYGPGSLNDDGTPTTSDRWASAPAQRVVITNTLSPNFDLSTFVFTRFGFGDFDIVLPEPSQWWQQILTMELDGKSFEVWFEAGIDLITRQVRVIFQSIDPTTSLPPEVLVGFLPPEDGTGRGQGSVGYSVAPVAGLPTGTQIRNIALIQFDGQLFIPTNQVDPLNPALGTDPDKEALVTIDSGAPQSAATPLAPIITGPTFTLNWTGQDDANGSGIVTYEVWGSTDGGAYVLWTTTDATHAILPVEDNRVYAFYTIAIDGVGNRELSPLTPDASTRTPRTIAWDGGVDGLGTNLADPINWVGDQLPTPFDYAVVSSASDLMLTLNSDLAFGALTLAEKLTISNATLTLNGASTLGGELVLLTATLIAQQSLTLSGTLRINPSSLVQVGQNFIATPTASIVAQARSASQYGRMLVTGIASFDGALAVEFVEGYSPARGDSLQIISASATTGAFTSAIAAPLGFGLKAPILISSTGVRLFITSIADTNNDGNISIDDLFLFLNAWFQGNGDVNGQNGTTIDDLFLYINYYFLG